METRLLYLIGLMAIDYIDYNVNFAITHSYNLKYIPCMIDIKYNSNAEFFNTKEIEISLILDKIIAINPRVIVISDGESMIRSDSYPLKINSKNNILIKILIMYIF